MKIIMVVVGSSNGNSRGGADEIVSGKKLYARSGKIIKLPQDTVELIPDTTFLDGEIW